MRLIGAIVGFFIIKVFFFTAIEDMGWMMFWHSDFEKLLNFKMISDVVMTSGFIKLAVGTIVGFELGKFLENGKLKKFFDDIKKEIEEEEKQEKNDKK
jgi:hypothetical protein